MVSRALMIRCKLKVHSLRADGEGLMIHAIHIVSGRLMISHRLNVSASAAESVKAIDLMSNWVRNRIEVNDVRK